MQLDGIKPRLKNLRNSFIALTPPALFDKKFSEKIEYETGCAQLSSRLR